MVPMRNRFVASNPLKTAIFCGCGSFSRFVVPRSCLGSQGLSDERTQRSVHSNTDPLQLTKRTPKHEAPATHQRCPDRRPRHLAPRRSGQRTDGSDALHEPESEPVPESLSGTRSSSFGLLLGVYTSTVPVDIYGGGQQPATGPSDVGVRVVPGYGDTVYGQRINQVVPNSPAFHAGLEPGDVIVDANGVPMDSKQDLVAAIQASQGYLEMKVVDARSGQLVWVVAETDPQQSNPVLATRNQQNNNAPVLRTQQQPSRRNRRNNGGGNLTRPTGQSSSLDRRDARRPTPAGATQPLTAAMISPDGLTPSRPAAHPRAAGLLAWGTSSFPWRSLPRKGPCRPGRPARGATIETDSKCWYTTARNFACRPDRNGNPGLIPAKSRERLPGPQADPF